MENTYCVIMAGGIGSRFWPMSTTEKPKQFLDVLGVGKSLLRQTYERLLPVCPPENILVVTNEAYKSLVAQDIPEMLEEHILCEPMRRNTAPCIAFASYKIKAKNPNATILVCPSDHLVLKEEAFTNTMKLAVEQARNNDSLVTLGIKPNRPDTGYGYIQFIEENTHPDERVKKVKTFTEKPSLEIAQQFLESGDFYWNSGIFIFNVQTIINSFDEHLHDMHILFSEGIGNFYSEGEKSFILKTFQQCPNISIDYGVMEKSKSVDVVLADFGWSDLGTWGSLNEQLTKDADGNAVVGKNVNLHDSKDCIIHMHGNQTAVIQGLEDYIVVFANNTLLISKKEKEQDIKGFVNQLKLKK